MPLFDKVWNRIYFFINSQLTNRNVKRQSGNGPIIVCKQDHPQIQTCMSRPNGGPLALNWWIPWPNFKPPWNVTALNEIFWAIIWLHVITPGPLSICFRERMSNVAAIIKIIEQSRAIADVNESTQIIIPRSSYLIWSQETPPPMPNFVWMDLFFGVVFWRGQKLVD